MKKIVSIFCAVLSVVLIICFVSNSFKNQDKPTYTDVSGNGLLKVHYIDVGQGDSCFIELPNDETMLIDCGLAKYSDTVTSYISSLGVTTIDYLIATHGDSDHIGGMEDIFENFVVESCYTSYVKSKTQTYQRFLDAVENEGLTLITPSSGDYRIDSESLDVLVEGPDKSRTTSDTNDASVVLLISYFESDFLFTGDSSYEMLESYDIGDIEVFKASHHGSYTGVSYELINELSPEYSVISVGSNNRYNHPHDEALELLKNSKIYMTSTNGTVVAECNGKDINFTTEK